jgi:hypothetical protein
MADCGFNEEAANKTPATPKGRQPKTYGTCRIREGRIGVSDYDVTFLVPGMTGEKLLKMLAEQEAEFAEPEITDRKGRVIGLAKLVDDFSTPTGEYSLK